MNDIQTVRVSTRRGRGADEQQTELRIDWTDCSGDDLKQWAIQALVVKLQGQWRRKGIPAKLEVRARDHRPGVRAAPATLEQQLAGLALEQRRALLLQYENELLGE